MEKIESMKVPSILTLDNCGNNEQNQWDYFSRDEVNKLETFLKQNDTGKLKQLTVNEPALVVFLKLKMRNGFYDDVIKVLKNVESATNANLLHIWDEAHYRRFQASAELRCLSPLQKFRIRQRNNPPTGLCPDGTRPQTKLADSAKVVLKRWFSQHIDSPYPSKQEKIHLAETSGASLKQVCDFFSNARRRRRQALKKQEPTTRPLKVDSNVQYTVHIEDHIEITDDDDDNSVYIDVGIENQSGQNVRDNGSMSKTYENRNLSSNGYTVTDQNNNVQLCGDMYAPTRTGAKKESDDCNISDISIGAAIEVATTVQNHEHKANERCKINNGPTTVTSPVLRQCSMAYNIGRRPQPITPFKSNVPNNNRSHERPYTTGMNRIDTKSNTNIKPIKSVWKLKLKLKEKLLTKTNKHLNKRNVLNTETNAKHCLKSLKQICSRLERVVKSPIDLANSIQFENISDDEHDKLYKTEIKDISQNGGRETANAKVQSTQFATFDRTSQSHWDVNMDSSSQILRNQIEPEGGAEQPNGILRSMLTQPYVSKQHLLDRVNAEPIDRHGYMLPTYHRPAVLAPMSNPIVYDHVDPITSRWPTGVQSPYGLSYRPNYEPTIHGNLVSSCQNMYGIYQSMQLQTLWPACTINTACPETGYIPNCPPTSLPYVNYGNQPGYDRDNQLLVSCPSPVNYSTSPNYGGGDVWTAEQHQTSPYNSTQQWNYNGTVIGEAVQGLLTLSSQESDISS